MAGVPDRKDGRRGGDPRATAGEGRSEGGREADLQVASTEVGGAGVELRRSTLAAEGLQQIGVGGAIEEVVGFDEKTEIAEAGAEVVLGPEVERLGPLAVDAQAARLEQGHGAALVAVGQRRVD